MTKRSLTANEKRSLAIKARHKNDLAIVAEAASENLTSGRHNRVLTDVHLELILVRVAAGDTVRSVCEELGVASGLVNSRAFNDAEFGEKLRLARTMGASSMFERMVECAWDESISAERARLQVQVLDRMASTYDRALSQRQQIDVRQTTSYILPPEAYSY